MGGLCVETGDIGEKSHCTLSAKGVYQLAKCGHFVNIPDAKIQDKSKSNELQKCLVVFQVAWMAMQCIARKSYGLPLTLLEVHTMVHVVCALLLYICWFRVCKPVYMLFGPVPRSLTITLILETA